MEKFLEMKNLERRAILWVDSKEGKYFPCIYQLNKKSLEI